MLTISSLTRDNYQQTRLFVDSIFAYNSVFSWPFGETFFHKKNKTIRPLPAVSLTSPHPTFKEKQQFLYTELTSHFMET